MNIFKKISSSLAWRLTLSTGIVIIIAVSLHIILLSSQRELFNHKFMDSERIGKIVETMILYDMRNAQIHNFQSFLSMLSLGEDLSTVRVYDNEGILHYAVGDSLIGRKVDRTTNPICSDCHVAANIPPLKKMNLRRSPAGQFVFQVDLPLNNTEECRVCHQSSQAILGNILTESTLSVVELRQVNHRKTMIFAGSIVLISAIAFTGLFFQRQVVRPLKSLVRVIEKSKQGKLTERLKLKRRDEIGYLVSAYNDMMDTLTRLQDNLEVEVEIRTKELESSRIQLLFRENLASLGRLAAGIAHEMGNPLTGISSIVQLLKRRNKNEPFLVEQLDLIHEEINRLARLSRQLVDLARPEDTKRSVFNVKLSIGKAYQIARLDRRLKNRVIKLPDNDEPIMVEANEDAIIQIIMNLLFNAADATAENGVITIEVKGDADNMVEVRVIDQGRGIPEEQRHRIFDPFFSSKAIGAGTGLGLSISYSLARSFSGNLLLESSNAKGSTFLLTIPPKGT